MASVLMELSSYGQTTNMIWAENLNYPITNGTSRPNDLVIDNAGNYYITGSFSGILDMDPGPGTRTVTSLGTYDIFIAKYTTNGNLIWAKSVGTNNDDAGNGIHVVNNKLYVVGAFQANSIDMDPGPGTYTLTGSGSGISSGFIATFDTSGTLQSAFSMPQCPVNSIKTDNSNNIYIGGQYRGSVDLDPGPGNYNKTSVVNASVSTWDLFYGKYTPTGSMVWANVKAGYMDDNANAISLDPITGNVAMAGLYDNLYIALANPSGGIINEANMGVGTVSDVAFDANSNFYFTGNYSGVTDFDWSATASYSLSTASSYARAFVIKYNSSNNFSWAKQITAINSVNTAQGPGINVDNNGNVLIIGRESNAGSNSWFYFAKMDANTGSVIWRNDLASSCYNGPSGNEGTAIAYNSLDGSVLVTGVIGGSSVGSSTPCSFDADPGSGVYTLIAGVGNTDNRDIFMGKYATCLNAPTNLSAISGSTVQCSGSTATYSISPVSGATSYVWSMPAGWTGSSITNTISIMLGTATTGTISVGANNSCGTSTLQVLNIQVNPVPVQPSAISGAVNLCGASVQTYSVPPISGATSYSWSLPGGWTGTSTSNTIQVNTGITGGAISVLAINNCGNGPARNLSITVNTLPSVSITGATSLCVGSSINLSASGANTYTWNTSSNSSSISISPTGNTSYNVTGTDVNGCTNTATKSVTVNALPSVSISGATSVCAGSSISLTASGATTYTWSTSSNSNSISVSPTANTSYNVTGKDVNGCTNTATKSVTVNTLPSVLITGTTSLCSGNSISLTASGATTYTWSTTSNSNSISVSPTVNTSYIVSGTDANGCINSATKSITVNALPFVAIGGNTSICAGTNATLTATGATTYTWSTGTISNSVSVSPPSSTTYSVIGADANGCLGTAGANVAVSSTLSIVVNGPSLLCSGNSATLNATGAATYTWSTGANTSSVSVSPLAFTIYTVTGTDVSGCTGTAYKNITVVTPPILSIAGSASVCAGNSISLSASGAMYYTWNTSATTNSISVSPLTNTTYSVVGIDANGCSGTAYKNITVNALPSVLINGATSVCVGRTSILAASGADTYTWSTLSNNDVIIISPTVNTSYNVTGTDVNGCTNTATKTVTVNPLPSISISISGATSGCAGNNISLLASGANTYTWSTSLSNSYSISVSPTVNSLYMVNGTDVNGCTNTATKSITVNPLPLVSISATSDLLCIGQSTTLSVVGATSYSWSTGSTNYSISVAPTTNTTYSVIGTDVNSCSNSAAITLSVSSCTGIESFNREEKYIKVYPNPAVSKTSILSTSAIHKVVITDMSGKIVAELLELNAEKTDVDLESYRAGMYLLVVYTEDGVKRVKLIKE